MPPPSVVGSASGATLAFGLLTGNVTITAGTEPTAQAVIAVGPVLYDGVSPVDITFYCAAQLIPASASCRYVVRRSDTNAVLGTIMRTAGANQPISVPVAVGTVITPPAGLYGLTMAGYLTGAASFTVQAGSGGPGDTLTPATLTVRSVLTVPTPARIVQLLTWKDLLIALMSDQSIWVLRALNIYPTGTDPKPSVQWLPLSATIPSTAGPPTASDPVW